MQVEPCRIHLLQHSLSIQRITRLGCEMYKGHNWYHVHGGSRIATSGQRE